MKIVPAKYRFFLTVPTVGEREIFPLYNPGEISFDYSPYNDYTWDFKVTANDKFVLVDDYSNENTTSKLYKPYTFLRTNSNVFVQSFDIRVKKFENGLYQDLAFSKLKILSQDNNQYIESMRKFTGKLETTSLHLALESVWKNEINILDTPGTEKETATLVSEAVDYENCFTLSGVMSYILSQYNIGVTLATDPFPYIASDVLIDNLLIADKTDIKRPNATSNATILNLSFFQVVKWMYDKFNLKYRIDTNGSLYFQHPTDRDNNTFALSDDQIINLTNRGYGFDNYEKTILFTDEESKTSGFVPQLIEYDVNEGEAANHNGDNLNNDLQFIIDNQALITANPDAKDEVSDQGFTLIGCDSSFNIYEDDGVFNARLQNNYLVEKCFYNDLFFNYFTLNGVAKQIISYRKRKRTEISVKNLLNFDVNKLAITSFGTCQIESAKTRGDNINLTLLY